MTARLLAALVVLVVGTVPRPANAEDSVLIAHCVQGLCPTWRGDDAADEIVVRQLFAAQIDSASEAQLPRWVAYRLVDQGVGVASLLPREWRADELVSAARVTELAADASARLLQPDLSDSQDRDYRSNEVTLLAAEQGRLAPMTGFSGTPFWDELNLLSNRARLPSALRLGAWSRLDQALNEFVARQADSTDGEMPTVYVVSGPIPADSEEEAGFFKVAVFEGAVAAYAFPASTESHADFCRFEVDRASIEDRTALTFFDEKSALRGGLAGALGCQD